MRITRHIAHVHARATLSVVSAAVVLGASIYVCAISSRADEGLAGPKADIVAPVFSLPDVAGRQVRLEDYRGKAVVLNFWAFWCDTWKDELPRLKELATRQEAMGFRILAISVDGTRVSEFTKRTGGKTSFPVLLDVGGNISAQYHVGHVPTVVLVDAEGRIRRVWTGFPGNAVLLSALRAISTKGRNPALPSRTKRTGARVHI